MTFAGIIDAMPLWAMALSVMLLLWIALCFRGLVAIVVTILCFIGLKSAGDPHLWIAIPLGLLVHGVLGAIAGLFPGGGSALDDGRGSAADHAAPHTPFARDYPPPAREPPSFSLPSAPSAPATFTPPCLPPHDPTTRATLSPIVDTPPHAPPRT